MFTEDELVPISALQHLLFCPRQCALIHLEQVWADNRLTVEGHHLHERADTLETETRGPVRISRGVPLRSLRLGLAGRADVVEVRQAPDGELLAASPVEYKRGRPKQDDSDRVQLCAQAMCLEEMLGVPVRSGALFYGTPRRRTDVEFDAALRRATEEATDMLHTLLRRGETPPARREPKCDSCSLLELCLPEIAGRRVSAAAYLTHALDESARDGV